MNVKIAVVALVAISALHAFAEDKKATDGKREPLPQSKIDEYNEKSGGLVMPPTGGKKFVFIDARAEAFPVLSNYVDAVENMALLTCETRVMKLGAKDCPRTVAFDAKRKGAGAVVLFYDRENDPVLSVYPEDAIVLVNCKPLRATDDLKLYSRRFSKEFWRSIGFSLGTYGIGVKSNMTSFAPVFSMAELDGIRTFGLAPMQMAMAGVSKARLGIYSKEPVTYARACREGWAPAPTNEVQKMFYDQFKNPASRFKADFGK